MQDKEQLCKDLISLCQLDIDAVHAYQQAIDKIDVLDVKSQLTKFQGDHRRHVEDLSLFIRNFGGDVPAFKPDFKGYFIAGFTALRSVTGTEGALKAMKTNEELTNSKYEKALSWDLPSEVFSVIQANREDERRHLEYVESCLRDRVWERKAA